MNQNALNILADAISDVGSWQWWHMENDMLQLEFRDVLLYDESKSEQNTHTMDVIAVRFYGNVFIVFLDDLDEAEEKPWYKRLYDDEIPTFECDGYENRTSITTFDGMDTLTCAKHLIAAKCGDAGVIAGGGQIKVVTKNSLILE
ncbi:hypothetical protein [Stomatobaculum longum]|uniref:hypothetical protein n=1 Tax=Stomatobaculum longum TaxID=796942 RepID=UPI0028058890|nr:hypothetical protein [Stomatobaculum longum]